ncbi:MAG: hypothetical protein HOO91_08065 [Bacteroidales bacterium]|nr:hypothetical protein [Bacteroidales bacterium]
MKPIEIKRLWFFFLICSVLLFSCSKESEKNLNTRTYRMGFQSSAPRIEFDLVIQSLHLWEQRADAAMITTEVPWDSLYNGMSPVTYVINNYKGLVDYYRTKNFKLWVYIDPANGLNRGSDALELVARHKSITQPDVQRLYRRFAFVMDSVLRPEHMGLALETNLIRGASPDSIYQGVKKAANDASIEIRAYDTHVKLSVSIQVDFAWGKLGNGTFNSIAQDFTDFPFIEELGMSSYPYFGFDKPQDIPLDYYSKLVIGKSLPVFISEGGWSSATVNNFTGTPEKQRDYIYRHAQLLDQVNAIAVFQLTFTDIDVSALPPNVPSNITLFSYMGLVDKDFNPKPALGAWDAIFKRSYSGKE